MSNSSILKTNPEIFWTQVEDEVILLAMTDQNTKYFGLRGVGTRIWQLIDESACTEEDICVRLMEEYDVEEATLRTDVSTTIEDLVRRDLIVTA